MSFKLWVMGIIAGIGEPNTQVSIDTHWAWSNAETAPYDLMRWNNPQNTTEKWPGSRDSGAQPGPHDVQIYRTVQDGIDATVWTLLNEPYYPAIVANLRAGLPRQQWGAYSTAGAELHAWGTGTNWLQATFGPMPGNLGEMMTAILRHTANGAEYLVDAAGKRPIQAAEAAALGQAGGYVVVNADAALDQIPDAINGSTVQAQLDALKAQIAAIPSGGGSLEIEPKVVTGTFTGTVS